jgi:septal ring factor EnvC (AmiA/AmiB activator)
LILDHGDGYMTLYGHNQALHKEVGNWVEAGETIAAVGSSGDATQAGLYFEIRHQGEPVDPLAWVGGRGRAARR